MSTAVWLFEPIDLALLVHELDGAADGVTQVHLTADDVFPRRRHGVFAVGHEHLRAGVQRVDDHLAIGGAGDFHAAVLQILRDRGDGPVRFADLLRLRQEVRQLAGIDALLALFTSLQQRGDARAELLVDGGNEIQCLGGKDRLVVAGDRRADRERRRPRARRCIQCRPRCARQDTDARICITTAEV